MIGCLTDIYIYLYIQKPVANADPKAWACSFIILKSITHLHIYTKIKY